MDEFLISVPLTEVQLFSRMLDDLLVFSNVLVVFSEQHTISTFSEFFFFYNTLKCHYNIVASHIKSGVLHPKICYEGLFLTLY